MSRLSAHDYARVLFEVTQGLEEKELAEAVGRFVELLKKRHEEALAGQIVNALERVIETEAKRSTLFINSANDLDDSMTETLKKSLNAPDDIAVTKQKDKKISGGVRARYGDLVLDATANTLLKNWKQQLTE